MSLVLTSSLYILTLLPAELVVRECFNETYADYITTLDVVAKDEMKSCVVDFPM